MTNQRSFHPHVRGLTLLILLLPLFSSAQPNSGASQFSEDWKKIKEAHEKYKKFRSESNKIFERADLISDIIVAAKLKQPLPLQDDPHTGKTMVASMEEMLFYAEDFILPGFRPIPLPQNTATEIKAISLENSRLVNRLRQEDARLKQQASLLREGESVHQHIKGVQQMLRYLGTLFLQIATATMYTETEVVFGVKWANTQTHSRTLGEAAKALNTKLRQGKTKLRDSRQALNFYARTMKALLVEEAAALEAHQVRQRELKEALERRHQALEQEAQRLRDLQARQFQAELAKDYAYSNWQHNLGKVQNTEASLANRRAQLSEITSGRHYKRYKGCPSEPPYPYKDCNHDEAKRQFREKWARKESSLRDKISRLRNDLSRYSHAAHSHEQDYYRFRDLSSRLITEYSTGKQQYDSDKAQLEADTEAFLSDLWNQFVTQFSNDHASNTAFVEHYLLTYDLH